MKRIFIAINLPNFIKEEILKIQNENRGLPMRWVGAQNLHITLCFIGEIEEEKIEKIKGILLEIASKYKPFYVYLDKVSIGPDKDYPRMLWITGIPNEEMKNLQKDILNSMRAFCSKNEDRDYKLHITIGRIINNKFKKFHKINFVDQEINLKFKVESFELMESKLLKDEQSIVF